MFNDTPEGTTHSFEDNCQPPHEKPRECCDECHTVHTEHDYPEHTIMDACMKANCPCHTFKALDESLDKLLEDDFVEEAKRQFIGMYPVAEWDRENGGHIYTTPTLNIKHRDLLEEWLIDTLQRHEAHVREKVGEEIKTDYII
jgi:hypothetical protein